MKRIVFLLCMFLVSCSNRTNREIKYATYVINLDKAAKRLKLVDNELSKQNIKYTRMPAVNGYDIIFTDLESKEKFTGIQLKDKTRKLIRWKKYFIDCGRDPAINFTYLRTKKYMLSAGEFGCLCSHRAVLLDAIKKDVDAILVFEDDINFLETDSLFLVHSAINQLQKNSVLYLDAHGPDVEKMERITNSKRLYTEIKYGPEIYGNYALIYDAEVARKILGMQEEIMPIDNRLGHLIRDGYIKGFLLNKKIITFNKDLGSDIMDMGRPH